MFRPSVAIVNHYGEILLSRYSGATWGIPGGILQLNESVEDCITRKVFQEIGLKIKEFYVTKTKECLRGGKKKTVCPFLLLETS